MPDGMVPLLPASSYLQSLPRWVFWRLVDRNGKPTKVPFNAVTGSPAQSNNAQTWATHAEAWKQHTAQPITALDTSKGGVGIMLGELEGGRTLCGLDLDTCLDPFDDVEPWAASIIRDLATYAEVSPSGTGIKLYFLIATKDMADVRAAMGTTYGKSWKRPGGGGGHPPAIELHIGNRFYAYTGDAREDAPASLRVIPLPVILNLIQVTGPQFASAKPTPPLSAGGRTASTGTTRNEALWARIERAAEGDEKLAMRLRGNARGLGDSSRSGKDMALGRLLRRNGFPFEEVRQALIEWPHGAGAEKAGQDDERYFQRIWDRAGEDQSQTTHGEDGLPFGFARREDGIYRIPEDSERPPIFVCGPLSIPAYTRDNDGDAWGRLLSWKDSDGRPHEWAMPMQMTAGDLTEVRQNLLNGGLALGNARAAKDSLGDLLARWRPPASIRITAQPGWAQSESGSPVFVLPNRAVATEGAECVRLQTERPEVLPPLMERGTLAEWQRLVASPSLGNSRLVLAICTALAAPTLHMLGVEGGGFHLRGPSSIGKSTAALVACSVWGGSEWKRSWRATDNGLEAMAAAHSDLLLVLDEMGEVTADALGASAYMLANGQGKNRADRAGGGRRQARWRLLFLSTGEISIAQKMADDPRAPRRSHAGQEVRVVDVQADAGRGMGIFENVPKGMSAPDFAGALARAAREQHGTAGMAFLQKLGADYSAAAERLGGYRKAFLTQHVPTGADGQVQRVAERFAILAAAGEMAAAWGVLPWEPGKAMAGIARCFEAWRHGRGDNGSHEDRQAVEQVRAFIAAHGRSRFEETSPEPDPFGDDAFADYARTVGRPRPAIFNRAGFRRKAGESEEFLILADAWKNEVCRGIDPVAAARAVAQAGFLRRGDGKNMAVRARLPDVGNVRVYAISADILGSDH